MHWIIFTMSLEKIPLNIFKQAEFLLVFLWSCISILQEMFQQILNIKSLPMTCTRLRKRKKKLWWSHLKAIVVFCCKLGSQLCLSKLVQELISLSTKFPIKHTSLTGHNISPFTHQHYLVIFRDVLISDSISKLISLLYTSRKIHVLPSLAKNTKVALLIVIKEKPILETTPCNYLTAKLKHYIITSCNVTEKRYIWFSGCMRIICT